MKSHREEEPKEEDVYQVVKPGGLPFAGHGKVMFNKR
jgi:hypothetical protein